MNSGPATRARKDARSELESLNAQLALVEQNEATLDAMLNQKKDSFHHNIASSTTGHMESIKDRKATLIARIKTLESNQSEN